MCGMGAFKASTSSNGGQPMTQFDPIRAQHEIISGLEETLHTVRNMRRRAEREMSEVEAALNAYAKLEAVARERLDDERLKLTKLEVELESSRTE
jgi:hypothetical protein